MIREIVQYPTPLSVKYATDVRVFDEELFSLIDDLKDTINENNLDALSAFQIGNYYNVIVVKDENGDLLEMINPRLISHNGTITTLESTAYYPKRTAQIQRFDKISVVYQDRNANDKSIQASGDFSVTIQRKIDYTFGATFIQKMSKEQKEKFEQALQNGTSVTNADYCPTTFKRDKILKFVNILMLAMLIPVVFSFFIDNQETLKTMWHYQLYTAYTVLGLNIIYFFYAQYEGKVHILCDSCQLGNIIITSIISLVKLAVIMSASYFLFNVA